VLNLSITRYDYDSISMLEAKDWTVAVFRCPKDNWPNILIKLSDTIQSLGDKVLSFHFTIRAYMNDHLWVSYHIFMKLENAEYIEGEVRRILIQLVGEDNFEVPPRTSRFRGYIMFLPFDEPEKAETHWGSAENWKRFCHMLNILSLIVIDMAKQNQFEGFKRQEIGHLLLNMLGIRETAYMSGALMDCMARKGEQNIFPYL